MRLFALFFMHNKNQFAMSLNNVFTAQFKHQEGDKLAGQVTHVSRFEATLEIHAPPLALQKSEVLQGFQILIGTDVVYEGYAIVTQIVCYTSGVACMVTLVDDGWRSGKAAAANGSGEIAARFAEFLDGSRFSLFILPEFKTVVADLQMVLFDLQHWIARLEFDHRAGCNRQDADLQRLIVEELRQPALPVLHAAFDRFEQVAAAVPLSAFAAHAAYAKRQLHPLVLCAPFMYRTFAKPLGYPGDYEMVDMMMRSPLEGGSAYAKLLNTYFLDTAPVIAHRNRLQLLQKMLFEEACRGLRTGQPLKVFNLGCGPAREIQDFLIRHEVSNVCDFTLLDFNDETLQHTQAVLNGIKRQHTRRTQFQAVRKSVMQVIKESGRHDSMFSRPGFDVVYCAGLFDYLTDDICQKLLSIFHRMLKPDGLLVFTNVDVYNPSRNWMEFVVDWFLFYRSSVDSKCLVSRAFPPELRSAPWLITADSTSTNVFVSLRNAPND